ncbi:MAG: DUF1592 domain-containing protein, partial [Deltaproteobacteria bacterium]|nr:DUF1592 domain-containing protein [Deltaproteobacteria bacterium]
LNTASPALVETYQRAAADVSARAVAELDALLGCDRTIDACGRDWLADLATRAWRRPLTADERSTLLSDYDAWHSQYGIDTAMVLAIQLLLQSPDFLYFPRLGAPGSSPSGAAIPLSDWELASRLSYLLWDSMPDAELFDLARDGRLQDRQVLADQAVRMLSDGRAVDMVVGFHRQNWDFDDVGSNPIDLEYYAPVFNERGLVAEDDKSDYYYLDYSPQLRFESDVFIARHVFHGDARLHTLLTSTQAWATPAVAELAYQQSVDANAEPVLWTAPIPQEGNDQFGLFEGDYFPITLDPARRAGLFTMAGFLGAKAGPQQPAPVRRGVTILDRLLCTELTPPGDVPPLELVEQMEPRTNRDKYAIHAQSEACAGCHRAIDGIGLTFEHYDAMGRWRDTDNGHPVDASGELVGTDRDGPVIDAVALMHELGRSRTVHDCYVRQWFRYAFGRNETIDDQPTLDAMQEGFWRSDGDILELIVNLAGSYSFRHRSAR